MIRRRAGSSEAAAKLVEANLQRKRREDLAALVTRLESGAALSDADRTTLLQMAKDVRDGYDARVNFGITKKPGPRPQNDGPHKWICLWFLKLRESEPKTLAKVHRGVITDKTGIADSTLRQIISDHREFCSPLLHLKPKMTLKTIREIALIGFS